MVSNLKTVKIGIDEILRVTISGGTTSQLCGLYLVHREMAVSSNKMAAQIAVCVATGFHFLVSDKPKCALTFALKK